MLTTSQVHELHDHQKAAIADYSKRPISIEVGSGKTSYMVNEMLSKCKGEGTPLIIRSTWNAGSTEQALGRIVRGKYPIMFCYTSKLPVISYLAHNKAFTQSKKNKLPRGVQRKLNHIMREKAIEQKSKPCTIRQT